MQAIKREVTGKSNAEKDALVAVARKFGLDIPDGPGAKDAADSWGAWLCGLRTWTRPGIGQMGPGCLVPERSLAMSAPPRFPQADLTIVHARASIRRGCGHRGD